MSRTDTYHNMASNNNTVAMDAMIDSLKRTSLIVSEVSSRTTTPPLGHEFPTLHSMILPQSTLCAACRSVINRTNRQTGYRLQTLGVDSPYASHGDETTHHNLEELARQAINGCRLCLLVYLGLDSESLGRFARNLTFNSMSVQGDVALGPSITQRGNTGLAKITPLTTKKAMLSFRYIQTATGLESRSSERTSLSPATNGKQSIIPKFDLARFELQRAAVGHSFELPGNSRSRPQSFNMTNGDIVNDEVDLRVDFTLVPAHFASELGIQPIPERSISTASDDTFNIARNWIKDCTERHAECMIAGGARYKPTYLLDVSIKDARGKPGVRLVDGKRLEPQAEYVTLSHAWGPDKPIRLHTGTWPALRQGVACSNISKTLNEAAMVTRRLGYRYLWVDALCIEHDSEQVVFEEISQMDKIYSNAVLNIAATCAHSDAEGFLRSRNTDVLQPCLLDIEGQAVDDGTYVLVRSSAWCDQIENAPLQKRAWVLQERLLAKRTLHFSQSELMWECRQTRCSETYPRGIPEEMKDLVQSQARRGPTTSRQIYDHDLYRKQTGNWSQIVELYSAGRLSWPSDKLLAIAGLAQQYSIKNGLQKSDYVVGLWKPELAQSLLWNVDAGFRPSMYRAPSWSWASVDGPVRYPETSHPEMFVYLEVIDIDLRHQFGDNFLLCHGARLQVCGSLARGLISRDRDYWGETSCSIQFSRSWVDFQIANFDIELPSLILETTEVYVLPVACTSDGVEGLLLTATSTEGEYERLGTFGLSLTNSRTNCEQFRMAMNESLDSTSYEERFERSSGSMWFVGAYRYIITLV